MTGPGAGSASRMRIAGIVLLAVAAVAAVVGLVALGSQGPSSRNTALPATSAPAPAAPGPVPGGQPPAPGGPQAAGPGLPGVGVSPGAPGAMPGAPGPMPGAPGQAGGPAVAAPIVPPSEPAGGAGGAPVGGSGGAGSGGAGSGGGSSPSATVVPVRVLNNSMITGLAERAAGELRLRGWNVVEVGNYPSGVIPVSTVFYRPGTDEEAASQTLAAQTGIRSEARFPGIADASPGLIVIATNNWGTTAPKS